MSYADRLKKRLDVTGSALCVGLDPRPDSTEGGVDGIAEFLRRVVGETAEYAAAFKPNMAYFEAMGLRGIEILEKLLEYDVLLLISTNLMIMFIANKHRLIPCSK